MGTPAASAGEVELSVAAGPSFPFYEQAFAYDPGPPAWTVPALSVEQLGSFRLEATGGTSIAAALAWFVGDHVGLEARFDTADVHVATMGAGYAVRLRLPPPLPDIATTLDLGTGVVEMEPLTAWSLNLKLRTHGRIAVAVSGGLSYLEGIRLASRQTVGLGLSELDLGRRRLEVASVTLEARAEPDSGEGCRFGANAGLGLRIQVHPRLGVILETRGFYFPTHQLDWGLARAEVLGVEDRRLLGRLLGELEPVAFNPGFFHAAAGVAVRF